MSEQTNEVPPVVDFSKSAIEKAVRRAVIEEPVSLYSIVGGALGAVGGLAFATPMLALFGGIVCLSGIGGKIYNFAFRHDVHEGEHLRFVRRQQARYIAALPDRIRTHLKEHREERGLRQLLELERSYKDFLELLEEKFTDRGLTLSRFQGIVDQTRIQALSKLSAICSLRTSVQSIDENELRRELSRKRKDEHIENRLRHLQSVEAKVGELYSDIEQSLTAISEVSIEVAQIGHDEDSEVKFETIMQQLRELSQSAATFKRET